MKNVLLFGATGNLGRAIAGVLKQRGYNFTAVVRSAAKAKEMQAIAGNYIVADVTNKSNLAGISRGYDVVVSALGKSVSLNDSSKPGFWDVDFTANSNILQDAKQQGVKKFVYVSAFNAEQYLHLNYFKVHHQFAELLMRSDIDYTIIKPPALFSAFIDLIDMAKAGRLVNIGAGDKRTNPIYEGDLANICVDCINKHNAVIEAGGKTIYTRRQLNEIIQQRVKPAKKLRTVPAGMVTLMLPLVSVVNKNMYDKLAFFAAVLRHDTIAPLIGEMAFENYVDDWLAGKHG